MSGNLLVIDDNKEFSNSLAGMLEGNFPDIFTAPDSRSAFEILNRNEVGLILLDIRLGNESGMDVLARLKESWPEIPVVMLTGFGTIETAVDSIKRGAVDYLQKPVKFDKLMEVLNSRALADNPGQECGETPGIASREPAVRILLKTARQLAASKSKIAFLVCGENGVGKELLADYIHSHSCRKDKQFLKVNCAAFPEGLLDNELFGHEKGAFTGAVSRYKGVFERAHGGSLFLDEIGDMSLGVQAKVLRVLQNGELYRLGGKEKISIDIQLISATNKNLKEQIGKGLFREDLYYRLNAATLRLPPLRERKEDIPLLAMHFLAHSCGEKGKRIQGFSSEVMEHFLKYPWPGNIRELKNQVNYASAICTKNQIELEDLPLTSGWLPENPSGGDSLESSERKIIVKELERNKYNKKKTAEALNISRSTLYSKLRKHGIRH